MTVDKERIDISIIIPARNEAENIGRCLEAVQGQSGGYGVEVIVIDSGSVDQTVEVVKSFGHVRLLEIAPEEFGHGRTRNLGAEVAHGKYLVFLNGDAVPADTGWLRGLVEPFERREGIGGVYSRHLPKDGCFFYMVRDLQSSMGKDSMVRSGVAAWDFMIFSTVSCAIPREVWSENRFADEILIAEDQEWGMRVLCRGYCLVYEPISCVYHSHNYTFREIYRVKYNVGRSTSRFKSRMSAMVLGFFLIVGGMFVKIVGDLFYIFFTPPVSVSIPVKFRELWISIRSRLASFLGRYMGWLSGAGGRQKRDKKNQ